MIQPRRIIATPFKSRNLRALEKTNIKIKDLIGDFKVAKDKIYLKNLKDKIESKPLDKLRPGRIE